ncbi:hypothetical protein [Allosalinactinospora lopnorensis]|uniref:hypothetical protein n=1 Tax=Allosalinactinospora lopnorensis TaxID=1352348 RepID=UPI000623C033|nr:hypothetical protein [Allosalinactinospora lopnorensis]
MSLPGGLALRARVLVFTLLGDSQAPMPSDAGGVFLHQGADYSPRLLLLTPAEAWALPTVSEKSDADPVNGTDHRQTPRSRRTATSPQARSSTITASSSKRSPRPVVGARPRCPVIDYRAACVQVATDIHAAHFED